MKKSIPENYNLTQEIINKYETTKERFEKKFV